MSTIAATAVTWPEAAVFIGLLITGVILIGGGMSMFLDLRKAKMVAGQEDDLRRLIDRYEQLAESTLDAQQRAAADLAEVRSRTASVEQILRTVE